MTPTHRLFLCGDFIYCKIVFLWNKYNLNFEFLLFVLQLSSLEGCPRSSGKRLRMKSGIIELRSSGLSRWKSPTQPSAATTRATRRLPPQTRTSSLLGTFLPSRQLTTLVALTCSNQPFSTLCHRAWKHVIYHIYRDDRVIIFSSRSKRSLRWSFSPYSDIKSFDDTCTEG